MLGFPIMHCLLWYITWEVNGNEVGIITLASFTPLMGTLTSAILLVCDSAFKVLFCPPLGVSYQKSPCSVSECASAGILSVTRIPIPALHLASSVHNHRMDSQSHLPYPKFTLSKGELGPEFNSFIT